MNKFNVIISKAKNERDILAYSKREMKIAESKEFYDPYDFRNDLLFTLSKLEQTENHSFERELNQLDYKISENVITSFVYNNYYGFCIDRNENRTFDDYLTEQYPIRESQIQIEIKRLTDNHNRIVDHYESIKIAIEEINKTQSKTYQLQTKLTDTQRGKLFDLLVSNRFILDKDKEGFIWAFGGKNDNYTSYSTEWLKTINLAVYLVVCLCYDKNVKIQSNYLSKAGKIFGIKNPRQTKKGYENNNNGTPDGHELIDTIISEAKK